MDCFEIALLVKTFKNYNNTLMNKKHILRNAIPFMLKWVVTHAVWLSHKFSPFLVFPKLSVNNLSLSQWYNILFQSKTFGINYTFWDSFYNLLLLKNAFLISLKLHLNSLTFYRLLEGWVNSPTFPLIPWLGRQSLILDLSMKYCCAYHHLVWMASSFSRLFQEELGQQSKRQEQTSQQENMEVMCCTT